MCEQQACLRCASLGFKPCLAYLGPLRRRRLALLPRGGGAPIGRRRGGGGQRVLKRHLVSSEGEAEGEG